MFKDADPQKGPETKCGSWGIEKLKGGGSFHGWKAGPAVWVWVHFRGEVSTPCHSLLTDGALQCPHCGRKPAEMIGYQPLYMENGKPVVVVCRDYSRALLCGIPNFAPVAVSRGRGPFDPIHVAPDQWTKRVWRSHRAERNEPAALHGWLVNVIWQQPALVEFFRDNAAEVVPANLPADDPASVSDSGLSLTPGGEVAKGDRGARPQQSGTTTGAPDPLAAPVDFEQAGQRALRRARAREASTNGDGKHDS